MILTSKTEK